jgi:hypothetical protein
MDQDRARREMTEPLDRELADLLRVEPSAQFVTRLRARLDQEAPARRGPAGVWVAGLSAAAAIVVTALVLKSAPGEIAAPPVSAAPHTSLARGLRAPLPPPTIAPVPAGNEPRLPAADAASIAPGGADAFSAQIVISESEARALHRLFVSASRGLTAAVFPADEVASIDSPAGMEQLQIPEIIIEPLEVAAQ